MCMLRNLKKVLEKTSRNLQLDMKENVSHRQSLKATFNVNLKHIESDSSRR